MTNSEPRLSMDVMQLVTIVGLLCNFKQERCAAHDQNHTAFMEWLETHRHEEIKNQIANSYHLQSEINALLQQDHEVMLGKLCEIEKMLATLLSRFDGFAQLANTVHPEWQLSDQAFRILKAFVGSGSRLMVTILHNDGYHYGFVQSNGQLPLHPPSEPQFFDDDMGTLVALGLLLQEFGSDGDPRFKLTRAGYGYVQALTASQESQP